MHSSKLLWLLPLVFLSACEASISEPETRYEPASSSNGPEIVQQSATQDSVREKVIRTADIRCHVGDVVTASAGIEHAVAAMGGHVEDSRMNNNIVSDKTVAYKPDSLRHVQVCHPSALLKLRVPSDKLDSVVNMLPSVAIYVDGRSLSREDVTLRYLSNEMLNTPAGKVSKVRVNGQEALAMNKYTDEQREKRVAREIENLDIEQRAAFSSLTVSLSQPEVVRVRILPETEGLMTTPYYMRCYMASRTGVEIIKGVILVLLSMWPLLLIGLVLFLGYRKMKRKRQQRVMQQQA
jgi:hypothetical protein